MNIVKQRWSAWAKTLWKVIKTENNSMTKRLYDFTFPKCNLTENCNKREKAIKLKSTQPLSVWHWPATWMDSFHEMMPRGYNQNCYESSWLWFHERNIRGRKVHVQGKTTEMEIWTSLCNNKLPVFCICRWEFNEEKEKTIWRPTLQCEVVLVFQKIEVMEYGVEKREVCCHAIFFRQINLE